MFSIKGQLHAELILEACFQNPISMPCQCYQGGTHESNKLGFYQFQENFGCRCIMNMQDLCTFFAEFRLSFLDGSNDHVSAASRGHPVESTLDAIHGDNKQVLTTYKQTHPSVTHMLATSTSTCPW